MSGVIPRCTAAAGVGKTTLADRIQRRGVARDGGDEAATSFWYLWMAAELPFMIQQQPWTRANIVVAAIGAGGSHASGRQLRLG